MNKPQILTLNLKPETVISIKDKGYNLYEGSLGKSIDISGVYTPLCLPSYDFPENSHEFDIIFIDLDYVETIQYQKQVSENNLYLQIRNSNLSFDPRYFALSILKEEISELIKHESIIVIFQSEQSKVKYNTVKGSFSSYHNIEEEDYRLYDFLSDDIPDHKNKSRKETKVSIEKEPWNYFLNKYNSEFNYKVVFDNHSSDNYVPLIVNKDNQIVSFLNVCENAWVFMFPQLDNYSDFVIEFLETIAPEYFPELFPNSTNNLWLKQPEYFLPNQENLLTQQEELRVEWEDKNNKIEQEILENNEKYKFLHDLLTLQGDELVMAIITYLEWLGFENVKNMDNEKEEGDINEEDIQIENEKGLLVIEAKGLGGTSKDSDCNQVLKIKYRRAKERNKFDVYGLYIVNHQKHLPPHERKNPPFTDHQITDANNEERGLLTTYQLFNLYFDIEKGIVTKEEARDKLYEYGLINFAPKGLIYIDTIAEIFQNGLISILNLDNCRVEKGDNIFVERNGKFDIVEILSIKHNEKSVDSISNGEIGIKTNIPIKKKSNVYIKTN